ncbi:hypothetical protein [Runella sp.]|uniref:hypothetical protein n=1 Tax=Runella sp. TaxID=1960881 RepID=UPI003D11AE08
MEQNKELIFEIICDDILFPESVKIYNKSYNTDFEILEFIFDEVTFAKVKVTKFKPMDIFQLGYQYGAYTQHKRDRGEIDW